MILTVLCLSQYKAKLRIGNATDLTRALLPAAMITALSASDLPSFFKNTLKQPLFQREKRILRHNLGALEETNLRINVSWHQDTMRVQVAENDVWLQGMRRERYVIQLSLALGFKFGLGLGDVMALTNQVTKAVCARSGSLLAKIFPGGVQACVNAKLQDREPFANLWRRPETVSLALHEALAGIVQLECMKALWLRDQELYVKQHLQGSTGITFAGQQAFSDKGNKLLNMVATLIPASGVLCEFGVNYGHSLRIIAGKFPKRSVHGFDSFVGLPEKWALGYDKGFFDQKGILPTVPSNVQLHAGWFNATVGAAMRSLATATPNLTVAFAHIDCDLYSSTRDVLQQLKPWLGVGTLLLFDEFFGYAEWREHEYKAWTEFATKENLKFRFVAHTEHPFHDDYSKVLIQLE